MFSHKCASNFAVLQLNRCTSYIKSKSEIKLWPLCYRLCVCVVATAAVPAIEAALVVAALCQFFHCFRAILYILKHRRMFTLSFEDGK